jgi:DNA recombination protein RmuC
MDFVFIAIGVVLGAAVAAFWLQRRGMLALADKDRELVRVQTLLDEERRTATEKLKLLEGAREQLTLAFKQLSSEILEDKSKRFAQQNQLNLDALLKPLGERIAGFEQQVKQTYDTETRDRVALKEQIAQLQRLNQQVSSEANALASALKGQSKTRGAWGEVVVERILEMSGLSEGREYEKQFSAQTETGGRRFPDFVVHLPGGRDIVIDSKLPLLAYLRAAAAADDVTRSAALAEHVAAVRGHVRELSAKDYSSLYGIQSLDFVLMCVPNEAAYVEALTAAPGLFEEAFEKKIVLVSPSNLWPTLRAVENMWRLERQSENAAEIARRAGDFYDKLRGFVDDLLDIRRHLDKAAAAHDDAMNKLSTGKGNLMNRAEGLRKLGIAVKKQLPLELSKGNSDDDENPSALEDRSAGS